MFRHASSRHKFRWTQSAHFVHFRIDRITSETLAGGGKMIIAAVRIMQMSSIDCINNFVISSIFLGNNCYLLFVAYINGCTHTSLFSIKI